MNRCDSTQADPTTTTTTTDYTKPASCLIEDLQIVRHRLVAVLAGDVLLAHKAPTRLGLKARLQVGGAARQHGLALLIPGQIQVVPGRDDQRNAVGVEGVAAAHVAATLRVLIGLHVRHHN